MSKTLILAGTAAGAGAGNHLASRHKPLPAAPTSGASSLLRPLAVGGGVVAGGLIGHQLLKAYRQRQEDKKMEQALWEVIGDDAQKTAADKLAMPSLIGAVGRFALRGSGLMRGAANRRLHRAVGKSHLAPSVNALRQSAQANNVKGPSLLNPLNLLTPFKTYGARRTAAGRTGWMADQASGNTRAWQKMIQGMDPVQARAAQRALTQTQIAGAGGKRMMAADALASTNPGLIAGSVVPLVGYEAAFRAPGMFAPESAPDIQRPRPLQAVSNIGQSIGDNPIGNWIKNNPGLATGAGLAAAGLGGYAAYRGLTG